MLLTHVRTLDAILHKYASALAGDLTAYRNHTYRVVNLCAVQAAPDAVALEKIAIAAAFHDLGIWTNGTFDYLPPSIGLARAYLAQNEQMAWADEITEMILQHHKVSAYDGNAGPLVETFRRADWIDVTRGLRSFGVPRSVRREVFAHWPNAGFHRRLAQFEVMQLRTAPWNPLPMVKL